MQKKKDQGNAVINFVVVDDLSYPLYQSVNLPLNASREHDMSLYVTNYTV